MMTDRYIPDVGTCVHCHCNIFYRERYVGDEMRAGWLHGATWREECLLGTLAEPK